MTQKSGLNFKHLSYSLADQGAVSAGNFLVIALGAHFLSFAEQGKLIYAFSAYYGLVIFNVAAFFSIPLLVRGDRSDWGCFRRLLLKWQLSFSAVTAVAITSGLAALGDALDWPMSRGESLLLCGFYLLQQLADFYRRSGYVFDQIRESTINSQAIFWFRVIAIFLLRPATLTEFLIILIASASIGALSAMFRELGIGKLSCDQDKIRVQFRTHAMLSKWGIINAPLTWGWLHLPLLLIGLFSGKEAAAIVGSIRGVAAFINVLLELLETFIPGWLATKLAADGSLPRQATIRLLKTGGAVWLLGLFLLFAEGERVVSLLIGKNYVPYSSMLVVIWLANGLYFVGRVVALHYRMTRDTLAQIVGSIGGLLALMLVALPFIRFNGVWGGAWAFVLVQIGIIVAMALYWMNKSYSK